MKKIYITKRTHTYPPNRQRATEKKNSPMDQGKYGTRKFEGKKKTLQEIHGGPTTEKKLLATTK